MPRGDWSLEVCDRHLWYGTWLICTCVDLWSPAEMTPYSEETCKTLTQNCLEEFIKEKKSNQRIQAFFVEDYVHDLFITFHQDECCVMKGKCYRSMSKSEKPHEIKMILEFADSGSNTVFRRCSCKAGQGYCHHLSALRPTRSWVLWRRKMVFVLESPSNGVYLEVQKSIRSAGCS